jgi:ABC-type multidrug transport system fused ATPase/permease subunit
MRLPPSLRGRGGQLLLRLVANGAAQAVTTFVTALLFEAAFDRLVDAPRQSSRTVAASFGILAAVAAATWLRMVERTDAERLGQARVHETRMAMYERLSVLGPRTVQARSHGAVVLRFVGDLNALKRWVSLGLARLVVATVLVAGALLMLAFLNPLIAAAVGVVLAGGTALTLRLGRPLREASLEVRRRRARVAANVSEQVAAIAVVQAFGQTRRERKRLARQSRHLEQASVDRARMTARIRGVAEATVRTASAAALLVGTGEVASGRATPGSVVAAMTVVGLLVSPLRDLGRANEYWIDSRVALDKINAFLATPTLAVDAQDAKPLRRGPGRLTLEGVVVAGALTGVTAEAPPGTRLVVVGPNGAGKTTLLWVLARLIDAEEGRALLDGQDLARHKLTSVRKTVGILSPDLPLLRGRVEHNLRYRWPDAPDEELARVLRLCGLDGDGPEHPVPLDARIAEGGRGLSAGQRQRIELARALVGRPRLLLLDEVDANLDPAAAALVADVIADHEGTVVTVSHRRERVAAADLVWHLDGGRLVEEGPPARLLRARGPTAMLFRSPATPTRPLVARRLSR